MSMIAKAEGQEYELILNNDLGWKGQTITAVTGSPFPTVEVYTCQNLIEVVIAAQNAVGLVAGSEYYICTLPADLRPKSLEVGQAVFGRTVAGNIFINHGDGTIKLYLKVNVPADNWVYFSKTFRR